MINSKPVYTQLFKFITIGLTNTIISYAVFFILFNHIFIGDAFLSQCLSYGTGTVWSFMWNRTWTFSQKKHHWSVFIPFLIVQVSLLLLSAVLLEIFNQNLNLNINVIWVCVMGIITIINFALTKLLVFKV